MWPPLLHVASDRRVTRLSYSVLTSTVQEWKLGSRSKLTSWIKTVFLLQKKKIMTLQVLQWDSKKRCLAFVRRLWVRSKEIKFAKSVMNKIKHKHYSVDTMQQNAAKWPRWDRWCHEHLLAKALLAWSGSPWSGIQSPQEHLKKSATISCLMVRVTSCC